MSLAALFVVTQQRRSVGVGLNILVFARRGRHTRCSRDWSSDVCSSDLVLRPRHPDGHPAVLERPRRVLPFVLHVQLDPLAEGAEEVYPEEARASLVEGHLLPRDGQELAVAPQPERTLAPARAEIVVREGLDGDAPPTP